MRYLLPAFMVICAVLMQGCSTFSHEKKGAESLDSEGARTRGPRTGIGKPGEASAAPLSRKVFYFPFDSADISPADRAALLAHARYLAAHPEVQVFIQGNADERGTREYNLALGERRALAVQRVLTLLGAERNKTEAVSFGQEQPVAFCHAESCWELNRRVELLYTAPADRP